MTSDNVKLCGGIAGPDGVCIKCGNRYLMTIDGCHHPAPEPPKTPPDLNRIARALGVDEGAPFTLGELADRAEEMRSRVKSSHSRAKHYRAIKDKKGKLLAEQGEVIEGLKAELEIARLDFGPNAKGSTK